MRITRHVSLLHTFHLPDYTTHMGLSLICAWCIQMDFAYVFRQSCLLGYTEGVVKTVEHVSDTCIQNVFDNMTLSADVFRVIISMSVYANLRHQFQVIIKLLYTIIVTIVLLIIFILYIIDMIVYPTK